MADRTCDEPLYRSRSAHTPCDDPCLAAECMPFVTKDLLGILQDWVKELVYPRIESAPAIGHPVFDPFSPEDKLPFLLQLYTPRGHATSHVYAQPLDFEPPFCRHPRLILHVCHADLEVLKQDMRETVLSDVPLFMAIHVAVDPLLNGQLHMPKMTLLICSLGQDADGRRVASLQEINVHRAASWPRGTWNPGEHGLEPLCIPVGLLFSAIPPCPFGFEFLHHLVTYNAIIDLADLPPIADTLTTGCNNPNIPKQVDPSCYPDILKQSTYRLPFTSIAVENPSVQNAESIEVDQAYSAANGTQDFPLGLVTASGRGADPSLEDWELVADSFGVLTIH
jgi:hypothetical protein